jgi:RHS repeat-associated protein
VEHWRGYVYDVLGRVEAAHEAGTTPSALLAGHEQPAVLGPQVDVAGSAVNSTRWGYLREEAVGSVIAISDAPGRNRFQASGSHTTPNGKWSARAPGYRLGGFDVGQVGRSMSHDEAGRVESDGHQDYVFDDEGLLAEVKGGAQEGYLYDALGRLVGKVRADGQLAEALVHDGAQLVEAWRSGSLAWTATWGPGLDNLVSIIDEQADEYLTLDDGKGSVIAWVKAGETQATTWAEYTVEGRATYHHERAGTTCVEEDDVRCDKPFDVPFGFHSAYGSSTTGLLYFRSRWYSPESGEWLSQDPLGNVDSDNLYAFNGFDPVNFVDPWGLTKSGGGTAVDEHNLPTSHPCSGVDPACRNRGGTGGTAGGESPKPAEPQFSPATLRALEYLEAQRDARAEATAERGVRPHQEPQVEPLAEPVVARPLSAAGWMSRQVRRLRNALDEMRAAASKWLGDAFRGAYKAQGPANGVRASHQEQLEEAGVPAGPVLGDEFVDGLADGLEIATDVGLGLVEEVGESAGMAKGASVVLGTASAGLRAAGGGDQGPRRALPRGRVWTEAVRAAQSGASRHGSPRAPPD